MNSFDLKNNAVFLSCWYERSRPVPMVCFGILILSILLLSFLSVSSQDTRPEVVWKALFYTIVGIQAVVLLVQGTMFASHMGSRERTSETLDFHRNSPQPVGAKVIGLIFGSTWFEWVVFGTFFVLELPFTLLPDVSIPNILLFNLSILLTGAFFHTTAATLSLLSTQKKRTNPFLALLLFAFFLAPILVHFLATSSSMFFVYLLGVTVFQYLYPEHVFQLKGWFYSLQFPLIVLQAIIQIPLLVLMANGMKRIFRLPNSPAWSKTDMIHFCGFLFFAVAGFFVAGYTHIDETLAHSEYLRFESNGFMAFFRHEVYFFTALFVAVGIMVSSFCVPSYFKCSKYAVLRRKGMVRGRAVWDDGASSWVTMISYVGLGGLFFVPYLIALRCTVFSAAVCFLMISSYVIAFAGFLEFFRLGRFRNNKIFFVTVLLVWWVFIPWMVMLMVNFRLNDPVFATFVSPFFSLGYAVSLLLGENRPQAAALMAPCVIAGLMWLLAWREHLTMEKQNAG